MARLVLTLILCVLLVSPCLSWEQRQRRLSPDYPDGPVEGPALGVAVLLEPSISVTILTRPTGVAEARTRRLAPAGWSMRSSAEEIEDRIRFYATAGPGVYDGDTEVVLLVSSNQEDWAIAVQAAPLQGETGQIPGDQVFVQSDYTDPEADEGGGIGYLCIGEPRVVARGTQTASSEIPLRFRLKTTYNDKMGNYTGVVFFNYLMAP